MNRTFVLSLFLFTLLFSLFSFAAAQRPSPGRVEVLRSVGTLAPDVVGQFREPIGFKQTANGDYYVFDRRAHAVYRVDESGRASRRLVQIGAEEGREIDPVVQAVPTRWPRRAAGDGELPLVTPTVRTAAVDGAGRLWVTFVIPFTYVYDADGEKVRTVQFRGAGIIAPASLSFTARGHLLVTPGCYEFAP